MYLYSNFFWQRLNVSMAVGESVRLCCGWVVRSCSGVCENMISPMLACLFVPVFGGV